MATDLFVYSLPVACRITPRRYVVGSFASVTVKKYWAYCGVNLGATSGGPVCTRDLYLQYLSIYRYKILQYSTSIHPFFVAMTSELSFGKINFRKNTIISTVDWVAAAMLHEGVCGDDAFKNQCDAMVSSSTLVPDAGYRFLFL